MAKAVSEGLRVAAMLGMLILVPLTAMFGSSVTTRWATWITEGPWGVKSASAREPTVSIPRGFQEPSLPCQPMGQEGQTAFPIFSCGGGLDRPIQGESPHFPPEGGVAFSEKQANKKERFSSEESSEALEALSVQKGTSPKIPLWGGKPLASMDTSYGESAASELLGAWQKDCPWLGRYLEKLGATEYRLTPWGTQGKMYHFQCQMEVLPGRSLWTRHFEATASSPSEAMQKVLDEVLQWRENSGN